MGRIDLKPCPFCGSEADTEIDLGGGTMHIYCTGCQVEMSKDMEGIASSGSFSTFPTMAGAIDELVEAWNRRMEVGEHAHPTT